ncbi:hypothetical protein BDV98DRAFT_190103 [Pterulicium gracile]|uniref:Uncharacterized protein n=1 Tax=Pterulicium gracile TaxID=1884261 RepID=A0A5C3QBJ7_9AGAR|nr:hypothetical protein BDV98DRAFT_190103 [Pterula gracilis]
MSISLCLSDPAMQLKLPRNLEAVTFRLHELTLNQFPGSQLSLLADSSCRIPYREILVLQGDPSRPSVEAHQISSIHVLQCFFRLERLVLEHCWFLQTPLEGAFLSISSLNVESEAYKVFENILVVLRCMPNLCDLSPSVVDLGDSPIPIPATPIVYHQLRRLVIYSLRVDQSTILLKKYRRAEPRAAAIQPRCPAYGRRRASRSERRRYRKDGAAKLPEYPRTRPRRGENEVHVLSRSPRLRIVQSRSISLERPAHSSPHLQPRHR